MKLSLKTYIISVNNYPANILTDTSSGWYNVQDIMKYKCPKYLSYDGTKVAPQSFVYIKQ